MAAVHGSFSADVTNGHWVDTKLKFRIGGKDIGMFGNVFEELHNAAKKLMKLELTEVELSILAALLLFCSGELSEVWYVQYSSRNVSYFFANCVEKLVDISYISYISSISVLYCLDFRS